MRISMKQRVEDFARNNPSFRWVNGKWFLNDQEITKSRIDRYLLRNSDCADPTDCAKWKECYIAMYGDDESEWPELAIIKEARQRLENGDKVKKLAYPLNDKELKILNYLLVGDPEYAIFFYGVGGSGKSSVCNIVCNIFGKDNCCFTSLADISHFNIQLEGSRLWFDDDINPYWTDAKSARFKPMVTNGPTQFEEKGRTPHTGRYRCKCLFASNHPVKFDITDTGMLRRIIYYKKDTKIENPDRSLVDKEYNEEELINIVMAALSMDMTDWEKDFVDETRETIMMSNSVWKYGMSCTYETYAENCYRNGANAYGQEKWEEIKNLFGEWMSWEE